MVGLLVFISSLLLVTDAAYLNELDGVLNFHCPSPTQTIYRVQSTHDNHKEDRRFDLSCRDFLVDPTGIHTKCFWTGFLNDYDQVVHFTCPTNSYINGMYSIHDNHKEDRRWKMFCCEIADVHLYDCSASGWTNEYDRDQDFTLQPGHVMKGMTSTHDNHKEDRIFEYESCEFRSDGGSMEVGK